jgi:hypothetical protein
MSHFHVEFVGDSPELGVIGPNLVSYVNPERGLTSAISSCELSRLCPQRLMSRVLAWTGILPSLAGGGGGGLIDTVMEWSILPELVGLAQLRVP